MIARIAAGIALAAIAAGLPGARAEGGGLPSGSIRIAFAGDTHGYRVVDNPSLADEDLLGGVRPVLGKADLFVFNHEGTLIDGADVKANCQTFSNQSTFAVDPVFAERLDAGVPMVASLANNHAMDCGTAGLKRTLAAFGEAGIAHAGAGMDRTEACAPLALEANGIDVAFVSYLEQDPGTIIPDLAATDARPGVATIAECDAAAAIAALDTFDVVIVLLHAHWGSSWVYGGAPEHVAAVEDLLAWGADLVVSSGPHMPQGALTDGPEGSLAFMGVGNFMFRQDAPLPFAARQSMLALVEIERSAVERAWLYPIAVGADGLPRLADSSADDIVALVDALSAQYDSGIVRLKRLGLAFPARGAP